MAVRSRRSACSRVDGDDCSMMYRGERSCCWWCSGGWLVFCGDSESSLPSIWLSSLIQSEPVDLRRSVSNGSCCWFDSVLCARIARRGDCSASGAGRACQSYCSVAESGKLNVGGSVCSSSSSSCQLIGDALCRTQAQSDSTCCVYCVADVKTLRTFIAAHSVTLCWRCKRPHPETQEP